MIKAFFKGMRSFRKFRVRVYGDARDAAYRAGREVAHILTFNVFRF